MRSTDYFKEHRSQKIYYFKKNDKTAKIIGNFCRFPQKEILYYTVDEQHSILSDFIFHGEELFAKCESAFHKYIDIALSGDYDQTDASYKMLCTSIKRIHPFFYHDNNQKIYIQEKILYYFFKSFAYYVTTLYENTPMEQIESALRRKFSLAIAPTVINKELNRETVLTSNSESKYPSDVLWKNLCILITDSTSEKISKTIEGTISYAKSCNQIYQPCKQVFHSLYNLKNILTYYICNFSDFIVSQKSLQKSYMLLFFFSRYECYEFIKSLDDQKIIATPHELFHIMMCQIKGYYHRKNKPIYMDDEYLLADKYTRNLYEHTLNSNQLISPQVLSQFIPSKLNHILDYEIHEFYYFEQLIYMELYQILTENMIGRICKRPGCAHCFFTSDKRRVYCPKCSDKPSSADQVYRNSQPPISKLKRKYYNKMMYKIRINEKINSKPDNINREKLTAWRKKATALEKSYTSSNRQNDIPSFESELKQLTESLGLNL